ncbi:MAG: tRNA (adenosine(37)-N6)-threonylcarbamoyltransferase complex ATPase subunit type 1 TsaE [Chloroflexi bacterium]|nr:tRNA (adenosine(37)-N6)-threonylcarbamoyltransferase complex ATPase subunit type 1 TsaE [Chloroflexota bacterium]
MCSSKEATADPSASASPWSTTTGSPAETAALGERLGRLLQRGDIVLLSGELGVGKTVFTQGLGSGLETPTPVRSSSFVLLSEHPDGRLPLFHADLYRLTAAAEVAELWLDEEAADGVLVVEWPERWAADTPADHLLVRFEADLGPQAITEQRRITIAACGSTAAARLQDFTAAERSARGAAKVSGR